MEKIPGPFKASAASAQVDNSVKEKKLFIKRRGNLPKQSVKILRNWLIAHQQDAYPCEKEKIRLAQETELTLEQVSNWFINARRRILPELLKRNGQNPEDYRITRKKFKSAKLCIDKTDSDSVDNTAKNNDEDLYLLSCLTSCNKNNSYSSEMHPISPNASKYLNRWSGFKTDSENNTDTEAGSDIGNLDCEELLKKISYELQFVSQDEKNDLLILASVANTRKKICVCVS